MDNISYISTKAPSKKKKNENRNSWRVYSIQHYVIKFLSDFRHAGRWFSPGTPVSSTKKIDRHDRTEILLKVTLSIINQTTISKKHLCNKSLKIPKR